jgi:hypothetical protein
MSFEIDVDHLIDTALKEGLDCMLFKNLLKSGILQTFNKNQQGILQSHYYQTVSFNLKLLHDLKDNLQQLNKKKIRIVLLQGIDLLERIYDDIGLRQMMDIDLWVLPKDYPVLISILKNQGYRRDHLYPDTYRKGATTFDLHTHILWADRIQARKLLLNISEEQLYHDTKIIRIEGQEARCLSPYDQVIYLSLHALKHCVNRLMWLVDIKNILHDWDASDWKTLMNRTRELGQEKTICYILFLLHHLLDFPLPLEARQLLERKRLHVLEKKILRERIKRDALPNWGPVLLFSAEKGIRRRFLFMLETLFPRPEILRQIFVSPPNLKVWQLYLRRFLQLCGWAKDALKR